MDESRGHAFGNGRNATYMQVATGMGHALSPKCLGRDERRTLLVLIVHYHQVWCLMNGIYFVMGRKDCVALYVQVKCP